MRPALRIACIAAACLFSACAEPFLTLGPTPVDEGIVIYIHSGFRGSSQAVAVDVRDLGRVEGPCARGSEDSISLSWDNCVSSIRVMPGWGATVYRDREFRGASFELTGDAENLAAVTGSCDGSFNDCVSSLRVYRK